MLNFLLTSTPIKSQEMDKRRTIFPGTAGDTHWVFGKKSPLIKRQANSDPIGSVPPPPKVLKKSTTLPLRDDSISFSIGASRGVVGTSLPGLRQQLTTPTYARLASLLPLIKEPPGHGIARF